MDTRSTLNIAAILEAAIQAKKSDISTSSETEAILDRHSILTELYSLAHGLVHDEISNRDPRFRDVMPPGSGTLAERLEHIRKLANSELFYRDAHAMARALSCIKCRAMEISSTPLDVALRDFFGLVSQLEGKRLAVMMSRFGWDGEPPTTLEEAGIKLDITRERVRQIQSRVYAMFPEHTLFFPQLRAAIAKLNTITPVKIDIAGLYLKNRGITTKAFDPRSIIAAAADCGIECSIQIENVRGETLVVSKQQKASTEALLKIARKQVGASGATNVNEAVEQVLQEGFSITKKKALRILSVHKDVKFLTNNWFWIPSIKPARNRLRNVARRMLSVTSPMRISDIRGGLRRVYAFRNISGSSRSWPLRVPPTNVLTEFFKQHHEFYVDEEGRAFPTEKLDYRKELGFSDQIFVDALRSSSSSVLDRKSLLHECRVRGINENNFSIATTYSPILSHIDLNIWTLRGVDVNPAAIEALRALYAHRQRKYEFRTRNRLDVLGPLGSKLIDAN